MASRIFDKLRVLGKERVDITGSFQANGSATSVLNKVGNGFSVVHTAGTANYVVTLEDVFYGADSFWCQLSGPSLGIAAQIIAEPNLTSKTFTISLYDTSTKASTSQIDLAVQANTRVHFGLRLKNTSGNF